MRVYFLIILLTGISIVSISAQCPSPESTLFSNSTISSNCIVEGNLTLQGPTLTINAGITLTVEGNLTIQGGATISASATSNIIVEGNFVDNWTGGGTNTISGGSYTIDNDLVELSGGDFVIDNAIVYADSAYTSGGAHLQILNGSEVYITRGMRNTENMTIDASIMDIGGDLDATGGDNITVRNNGELIVRGDYKMNNGGGVDLLLESGGLVNVVGNIESTSGGNTIDVDDNSGISVGGDFTGGSPPAVSVGTDDDDSDCLVGGGCCGDPSACGSATTLPVTLLNFETQVNQSVIQLNWSTASELNNDYFTVERSLNGFDFIEIATISGSGTTNDIRKYSYEDNSLFFDSFIYYRLSQTDYDGTHKKLKINVVNNNIRQEAKVYPNPIVQGNTFRVQNIPIGSSWVIYALSGKIASRGELGLSYSIDSSNVPRGTYLLVFNGLSADAKRIVIN